MTPRELSLILEPVINDVWLQNGCGALPERIPHPFVVPQEVARELKTLALTKARMRRCVKAYVLWFCYTEDPGFFARVKDSGRTDLMPRLTARGNAAYYEREFSWMLNTCAPKP